MRAAVVIDYDKVRRLKLRIKDDRYMKTAVDYLAYEIAWLFT